MDDLEELAKRTVCPLSSEQTAIVHRMYRAGDTAESVAAAIGTNLATAEDALNHWRHVYALFDQDLKSPLPPRDNPPEALPLSRPVAEGAEGAASTARPGRTRMQDRVNAFVDTNVLLHYPPLAQVDWCSVCDAREVQLTLCLPVVKELDKYKSDARLGERARRRIKEVAALLDSAQAVRPGVRLVMDNDPLRSVDFPDTLSFEVFDDQIVHFAIRMKGRSTESGVAVITEDLGMRLRCKAHGIVAYSPPDNQRLSNPLTEEQKQVQAMQRELKAIKEKSPALRVLIEPSQFRLRRRKF